MDIITDMIKVSDLLRKNGLDGRWMYDKGRNEG